MAGAGRPAGGNTAAARARRALLQKQSLLLTWITDEPAVFPKIRAHLGPADFEGEMYRETARLLWDQMESDPSAGAAARVISAFETQEQQEEAAAMFRLHLPEEEDRGAREKTLRELVYAVREASVDRMMAQSGGGGPSLQEILEAKKDLQALRSAKFYSS